MAVKGVTNNPNGAPNKLEVTKEVIEKAASLYGLGVTQDMIAESLGISLATLKRYMTTHPDLKTEMFKRLGLAREHLASKFWKKLLSDDCPPGIFLFGLKIFLKMDPDKDKSITLKHDLTNMVMGSMNIPEDEVIEVDSEDTKELSPPDDTVSL